jgi:MoaA/NifB/PqqE/SkfB family radical SAM enzyme
MVQLYIDNMVFEVTRKCNMKCEHCLRGCAENLDITEKVILEALKDVNHISSLTITGGEPTLNIKAIEFIFNQIRTQGIELNAFWMATNAKIYSSELVSLLIDEYATCTEYDDEFYGGLAVSHEDGFHEYVDPKNIRKYKALKFYDSSKEGEIQSVIDDGYANYNGIGSRTINSESSMDAEIEEDCITVNSMIYINAKGDVLLNCDYSYERQEEEKIGNILEESLESIILRYAETQD